jgi:hypothetical protein
MTPKENAEQLFNKFNLALIDEIKHPAARNFASYKCFIIFIDEVTEALKPSRSPQCLDYLDWLKEMKKEIENL